MLCYTSYQFTVTYLLLTGRASRYHYIKAYHATRRHTHHNAPRQRSPHNTAKNCTSFHFCWFLLALYDIEPLWCWKRDGAMMQIIRTGSLAAYARTTHHLTQSDEGASVTAIKRVLPAVKVLQAGNAYHTKKFRSSLWPKPCHYSEIVEW
jgi:hypothetical protein